MFKVLPDEDKKIFDALWEDSEVMLFTTDKEESYNFALNTQYKCFYLDDENFNIDDLLEALENK